MNGVCTVDICYLGLGSKFSKKMNKKVNVYPIINKKSKRIIRQGGILLMFFLHVFFYLVLHLCLFQKSVSPRNTPA